MINFPKVGLFAYLTEIRFRHFVFRIQRNSDFRQCPTIDCRIEILTRSRWSDVALAVTQTDREGQTKINHAQHQCVLLCKQKTLIFEPFIYTIQKINLTNVHASVISSSENDLVKLLTTLRRWHINIIIGTKTLGRTRWD